MKTLPKITYVVTAKYTENKAGLKSLFRKSFNDDDFPNARNLAFDYYAACVEMLMDNREITFDGEGITDGTNENINLTLKNCNDFQVEYANVENFQRGIQIFLRINKDIKLRHKTLKEGDTLLLESFNFLNPEEIYEIAANQKTEIEIYNNNRQRKNWTFRHLIFNDKGYFEEHFSFFTHHIFHGSKSHQKLQVEIEKQIEKQAIAEYLQLLKNDNPLRIEFCKPEDLQSITETVCAFMNSDEVCYISIDLPKLKVHLGNNKTVQQIQMDFLQKKFVFDAQSIRFYSFSKNGNDYGFYRIDGKNCSSNVGFPRDEKETFYESYERARFGNILVMD